MTAEDLTSHRIIDRRKALMAGTTLVAASAIGAATPLRNAKAQQQPATLAPSPSWTRALPAGPDRRVKITEEYAKHVWFVPAALPPQKTATTNRLKMADWAEATAPPG